MLERKRGQPVEQYTRRDSQGYIEHFSNINFSIPERFRGIPGHYIISGETTVTINELTGLLVETKFLEGHLAERLSAAIRNGRKWALAQTDVDNLKHVNDVMEDRPLGDVTILYGAAKITQAVEKVFAPDGEMREGVEVYVLRGRDAADETLVLALGVNDDELVRFREELDDVAKPTAVKNPNFSFSISTGLVTSDDSRIEQLLEPERIRIESGETSRRFYASVKELADKEIKMQKVEKDLTRLDLKKLLEAKTIAELILEVTELIGGTRISKDLLEKYSQFVALAVVRQIAKNHYVGERFIKLLSELGLDPEELDDIASAEKVGQIFEIYFDRTRPEEPEENSQ